MPSALEKRRILLVEDDEATQRVVTRILEDAGYDCVAAGSGDRARELIRGQRPELVLCDVHLPDGSGLDLARGILAEPGYTAVLMLSGADDPATTTAALDYGAYGYLVKPVTSSALKIAVMNAIRRRDLECEQRLNTARLEALVDRRTASLQLMVSRLQRSAQRLEFSQVETMERLSCALDYRDSGTGAHVARMSRVAGAIARELAEDWESIELASPMHDIGKIGIPDAVLLKRGPLSSEERAVIETHPQIGYELLGESDSELLQMAASIARTHHERYDGSGYPFGLVGRQIPIEGRIAAVADVFDALTTTRPYRPAFTDGQAVALMRRERGAHFDPVVLDAFMRCSERLGCEGLSERRARRRPPGPAGPLVELDTPFRG